MAGVAQPLVFLEMASDKNKLRTEFARLPSRYPAANPEGLGFVRSGKDNFTTDGDGFAALVIRGAILPPRQI
jgi:hypothetical protein